MMYSLCSGCLIFLVMKINESEETTTLQQKSVFVHKRNNNSKETTSNTNRNPTKWFCDESKGKTVEL